MTREELEKRFKFELELEMGKYKVKYTTQHKIVYFTLKYNEDYNLLFELEKVLNRIGYKKLTSHRKDVNSIKVYLDKGTYRLVASAPYFESKTTPRNQIPDFIKEFLE